MNDEIFQILRGLETKAYLNQGTGSNEGNNIRIIEFPFERFIVNVKVSLSNEFIGIESVSVNKDFLSYKEKIAYLSSKNNFDTDKHYDDLESN